MNDQEFTPAIKINLILIALITLISLVAVYHEFYKPTPNQTPSMNDSGGAVKSMVKSQHAFFSTRIFLDRDQTFVLIPFQFTDRQQEYPLWLRLSAKEGPPLAWLMYHPQLMDLDWVATADDTLTLYQKSPVYDSVAGFLQNPPENNAIVYADPRIVETNQYPDLQAEPITDILDLNSADYILTTFKKPTLQDDDFYYYEVTLDASEALVNEDDHISWEIIASGAGPDNPLYLKEIHVDYRQN